jgi:hypothetical protein
MQRVSSSEWLSFSFNYILNFIIPGKVAKWTLHFKDLIRSHAQQQHSFVMENDRLGEYRNYDADDDNMTANTADKENE